MKGPGLGQGRGYVCIYVCIEVYKCKCKQVKDVGGAPEARRRSSSNNYDGGGWWRREAGERRKKTKTLAAMTGSLARCHLAVSRPKSLYVSLFLSVSLSPLLLLVSHAG